MFFQDQCVYSTQTPTVVRLGGNVWPGVEITWDSICFSLLIGQRDLRTFSNSPFVFLSLRHHCLFIPNIRIPLAVHFNHCKCGPRSAFHTKPPGELFNSFFLFCLVSSNFIFSQSLLSDLWPARNYKCGTNECDSGRNGLWFILEHLLFSFRFFFSTHWMKAQKPPHFSLLSRGTLFFAVGHSGQLKNPFVLLLFFFFLCLSARLSAFSVVSVSQFRYKKVEAHIVCTLGPPTTRIALTLYPQIISKCLGFHFHFTMWNGRIGSFEHLHLTSPEGHVKRETKSGTFWKSRKITGGNLPFFSAFLFVLLQCLVACQQPGPRFWIIVVFTLSGQRINGFLFLFSFFFEIWTRDKKTFSFFFYVFIPGAFWITHEKRKN